MQFSANKLLARACNKEEQVMAKGQVRSTKEARKPKKDKAAPKAAPALGSQVKSSESDVKKK